MNEAPRSEAPSESRPGGRAGTIRRLVRIACLLAASAVLCPLIPGSSGSLYVTAVSPFVAAASLLATGRLSAVAGLGLAMGILTLVRRRVFCRWFCPMGVCMDVASRAGRRWVRPGHQGPRLGLWIALVTLGGACLGYPLLLWLDPMAIFAGAFDLFGGSLTGAAWVSAAGFLLLLGLSLARPGIWCARTCPLGALQDLLFRGRRAVSALVRRKSENQPPSHNETHLARRIVLGTAAGAVLGRAAPRLARPPLPLRPPGARSESQFVGLCTRCGNCVRACPSGIIQRDLGQSGFAGLLTPALCFEKDYCRQDCVRCTEVCPSGALAPMPLDRKPVARIGLPAVDMSLCLLGDDRECAACARWCPYGAIRYVFSEQEYTLQPQIDPNRCNGCGACEVACPTKPKKAIVVRPVG